MCAVRHTCTLIFLTATLFVGSFLEPVGAEAAAPESRGRLLDCDAQHFCDFNTPITPNDVECFELSVENGKGHKRQILRCCTNTTTLCTNTDFWMLSPNGSCHICFTNLKNGSTYCFTTHYKNGSSPEISFKFTQLATGTSNSTDTDISNTWRTAVIASIVAGVVFAVVIMAVKKRFRKKHIPRMPEETSLRGSESDPSEEERTENPNTERQKSCLLSTSCLRL